MWCWWLELAYANGPVGQAVEDETTIVNRLVSLMGIGAMIGIAYLLSDDDGGPDGPPRLRDALAPGPVVPDPAGPDVAVPAPDVYSNLTGMVYGILP